jgi:hypothetical protein
MAPALAEKPLPPNTLSPSPGQIKPHVTVLAQQLGWNHFKEILYIENELARQFYAEKAPSRAMEGADAS